MTALSTTARPGKWPIGRFVALFVLWVILIGAAPLDLVLGVIAAAGGAYASLSLIPIAGNRPSPAAIAVFIIHFLKQSILAGIDIARRAFDPKLPLAPGLISFPPALPKGPAQSSFCTVSSMVPGTLPVGPGENNAILVHCLDRTAPAVAQMKADEALIAKAIGSEGRHV